MKRNTLAALAWAVLIAAPTSSTAVEVDDLPRVVQTLVPSPFVLEHDQLASGRPRVLQVRLEIEEKKIEMDYEGAEVWAMTFGGTVPGPLIAAHQDDYVELTLVNPNANSMVHNIDLHAATGAMGASCGVRDVITRARWKIF